MKEIKKVKVEVEKEEVTGVTCDQCGKEVDLYHYYDSTTSHNNWGSDSHESVELQDFCSLECVLEYVKKYFIGEPGEDRNTYEITIEKNKRYNPRG